jgi:trigger factor
LNITTEPLEHRQLLLTIEMDEDRVRQAMQRAARQIAKQVNIPGFRRGKAPYSRIVQRYGEETIRQEAAEALAQKAYGEALEQEEIEPYAPAKLEDIALHPLTFKFTVSLPPTVDLGDYGNYRLKQQTVRVDKEDVQQALEEIREENAILEYVDRPAELGDGVVIDIVGRAADGEEFLKGDDIRIILDAESTDPAPGFAEAVVGMEADDERTFTLTLPDDFPQEELRGQEAEFTVRLAEVYDSIFPELDDDLARTVGNFDSLKELEEHIREQLREAEQRKVDEEYAEQVLEAIIEQAQVEYPPVMIEETLNKVVEDVERRLKREAHLSLKDYLHVQGQTVEQLREELTPRAAAQLKRSLVLGEVVTLEKLEVDKEEISEQIEAASALWGARADEIRASLSSDAGRQAVRNRLLAGKAVQRLISIAKAEASEEGSVPPASGGEVAGLPVEAPSPHVNGPLSPPASGGEVAGEPGEEEAEAEVEEAREKEEAEEAGGEEETREEEGAE